MRPKHLKPKAQRDVFSAVAVYVCMGFWARRFIGDIGLCSELHCRSREIDKGVVDLRPRHRRPACAQSPSDSWRIFMAREMRSLFSARMSDIK